MAMAVLAIPRYYVKIKLNLSQAGMKQLLGWDSYR
jgi:hypothetical protein